MNKKELKEIKKAITNHKDTVLSKISLCYVSDKKEKVLEETVAFGSLPEDESFKYLDLFKKALSGGFGKNLFHVEIQDETNERAMLSVMQSTEKEPLYSYFDGIIESYNFPGNYLIITGHGFYDYATRLSDGSLMEDSDNTYEFLLTLICPVELSKPGLSVKDGAVKDCIRNWLVGQPQDAVLFPTFTDRESNVHEILYYSKNNKNCQAELLEKIVGNDRPNSEKEDKNWFSEAIKEKSDMPCDFEVVKEFQGRARDIILEDPAEGEVKKSAKELKEMLEDAGLCEQVADNFVETCQRNMGSGKEIVLNNLTDIAKATMKGSGFSLKINADKLPEVAAMHIDGKNCLVIPLDSSYIELNGIETSVKILK